MPPLELRNRKALGEPAFEAALERLLVHAEHGTSNTTVRDMTDSISRMRAAAAGADYLTAIRLLGDVEVTMGPAAGAAAGEHVNPEDVEQALGDLRRALIAWGSAAGREAAKALCEEARRAAGNGRWQVAWALIEEADLRLADSEV